MDRLDQRQRSIIYFRFFEEVSQAEVARRLGISQMHVSRLLAKTLRALRDHVVDGVPLPASWPPPLVAAGSRPPAS
jgi:RNA polymerase sigma-B factor